MKNWAAIRRKSRQVEQTRAVESKAPRDDLPAPAVLGPHFRAEHGYTGVKIMGGHVKAEKGATVRNNVIGVDNEGGIFDGPDIVIE